MEIELRIGHIKALDGLRGFAMLLVLMIHCYNFYPFTFLSEIGWIGMDLFFVLSGFLITGILLDTKGKKNCYRNFIVRRSLRIFPLYYFVLIIFFSTVSIFALHAFDFYLSIETYFWTYTQNIYIAFHDWPQNNYALWHLWSVAVEEQFYLFWPLVILLLRSKNIYIVSIAGIIISVSIRNYRPDFPFSHVFTFARIDSLLIGGCVAVMIREQKGILEKIVPYVFLISVLIIGAIILCTKDISYKNIYFVKFGYTLFSLAFGCILTGIFDQKKTGRILNVFFGLKLLTITGKYSYGIYIYHWIFFIILLPRIIPIIEKINYLHTHAVFISTLIFTALTFTVSYISYHLFEKQFLKLKSHFR